MPTIFDQFQPLNDGSKETLVNYNKNGAVNEMALALTRDEYKNLLPLADRVNLANRDAALEWLRNLIPLQANRAGEWRLYFVKNYAQTWIKNRYPGNAQAAELAAKVSGQVSNARGLKPTMAYYTDVRAITVPDGNQFKGEYDAHVKKNWAGVKQVGWRGDDRDPDLMMKSGFSPRISVNVPVWRPQESFRDVDLDTTVCVARDVRGSAFFPLSKPVQFTWAYCVLIREGWNTYYLQKKLAAEKNLNRDTPAYNKTVWMFHEKCVNRIEPKDIVIAVQLERKIFDGNDPLSGIQFRLISPTGRTNFRAVANLEAAQKLKIEEILSEFSKGWYPSGSNKWLTYDGVVTK